MGKLWKRGDRVKVMDPWRGVVECFRGTVKFLDPARYMLIIIPDYDRGQLAGVNLECVRELDDNRLRRWAA